jgi:hypothetical protein
MNDVRYDIHRDGRLIGSFTHGAPTRFKVPMTVEVALQEFQTCIAHHETINARRGADGKAGLQSTWELRIFRPKDSPITPPS